MQGLELCGNHPGELNRRFSGGTLRVQQARRTMKSPVNMAGYLGRLAHAQPEPGAYQPAEPQEDDQTGNNDRHAGKIEV